MSVARTFRLPDELDDALTERHVTAGEEKTKIVIEALRVHLGVPEGSKADATPQGDHHGEDPSVQAPPESRMIDLPRWLSERSGEPQALCRLWIRGGRVLLDGEPTSDLLVPRDALGEVRMDGRSIKP
jgi:hypothetical protein